MEEEADEDRRRRVIYEGFRERVFYASGDVAEWSTVPLTFVKDGKLTFDRTGVLLQIGEQHFLITAKHDLGAIIDAGYLPFAAAVEPGGQMTPLAYDNLWLSTNDEVDLAFFLLHPLAVKLLDGPYRFLRLGSVVRSQVVRNDSYFLVTGFPTANEGRDAEERKKIDVFRYLTHVYEGELAEGKKIDSSKTFLLTYDKESRMPDGSIGIPPNPKGCSGCGVWFAGREAHMQSFTADDLRLAGIQVAWDWRYRFLKVTWIDEVLAMMWNKYSDTRTPLRMVGFEF